MSQDETGVGAHPMFSLHVLLLKRGLWPRGALDFELTSPTGDVVGHVQLERPRTALGRSMVSNQKIPQRTVQSVRDAGGTKVLELRSPRGRSHVDCVDEAGGRFLRFIRDRPFRQGYAVISPDGAIVCRIRFGAGRHLGHLPVDVVEENGRLAARITPTDEPLGAVLHPSGSASFRLELLAPASGPVRVVAAVTAPAIAAMNPGYW